MATSSKDPPLGQFTGNYWIESRRPLAGLVFVTPLLLAYELGVLLLGAQNGADVFMRRLLDLFGFGQHFVLPILTVCILLSWHYLSRGPWRLSGGIISAMAVESVSLGICLRAALSVQDVLFQTFDAPAVLSIGGTIKEAVGFLGAGIYEELLFRVILLSVAIWGLHWAGLGRKTAVVMAVILISLLFSAAHHIGPGGQPFRWFDFIFRSLAGGFFSIVFVYRGFGIAAGSHAAYDILAWLT